MEQLRKARTKTTFRPVSLLITFHDVPDWISKTEVRAFVEHRMRIINNGKAQLCGEADTNFSIWEYKTRTKVKVRHLKEEALAEALEKRDSDG